MKEYFLPARTVKLDPDGDDHESCHHMKYEDYLRLISAVESSKTAGEVLAKLLAEDKVELLISLSLIGIGKFIALDQVLKE